MSTEGNKKTNKLIWIIPALALIVTFGTVYYAWNQNNELTQAKDQLASYEKNTKRVLDAFTRIDQSLQTLGGIQNEITTGVNEGSIGNTDNLEDRINAEIQAIETLLERNKSAIADLETELGAKDETIEKYKGTVSRLERSLRTYKAKNSELLAQIDTLNNSLNLAEETRAKMAEEILLKQTQIDESAQILLEQSVQLHEQLATINEKDSVINTAFFAVGTFQELKERNIITKKGGIAGIASTKRLNKDFNGEEFEQINIQEKTIIPVYSKDVELVTNHKPDSYEIVRNTEEEVEWIKIHDPQSFWSGSKYLVVVRKEGFSLALQ